MAEFNYKITIQANGTVDDAELIAMKRMALEDELCEHPNEEIKKRLEKPLNFTKEELEEHWGEWLKYFIKDDNPNLDNININVELN